MAAGETPVPPTDAPSGGPGRRKTIVLVLVAVLVVASLSTVAFLLLSAPTGPPPPPATLDHVTVSASRTTIDQREQVTVTANAIDTKGVDESANASFAFSASPTSRVQLSAGAQSNQISAVALSAGAVSIAAQATWKNLTKLGEISVTIAALHYELTASNNTPLVGTPVDLTVRVLHVNSSIAASYRGQVAFASDDPLATLPASATFTGSDAGVHLFTGVIIRKAGSVQIAALDTLASITGSVSLTGQRPQHAPAASFTATRDLMHVDVDASATTDPDNDVANYTWAWGDGARTGPQASPLASHTYTTANRYTIALTVTDATNLTDLASERVSVAPSTLDYTYADFFEIPYADFWDLRAQLYYELPVNAECFNATAVAQGVCIPSDPAVPDVETYPYTEWYATAAPGHANSFPAIYAPYRWRVTGLNVPGYNLSEPVFLPVMNYGAAPGNLLRFKWDMQYLNKTAGEQTSFDCGTNYGFGNDGYILRSDVSLTMDLQESKRLFGVVADTPAEAAAWWKSNTDPSCLIENRTETQLSDWFYAMGGSQLKVGKYDIQNGYEWYYQIFAENVSATVDTDGTTHLWITHVAYGTEVLLARFFYWGNASYIDNVFDSTAARGWWGMENAWFEDFHFAGSLVGAAFNFTLTTVEQYHFQQICGPGPNGIFDRTDDVAQWIWGPWLDDYRTNYTPQHPYSELERYPTQTYVHCTPGSPSSTYGADLGYDYLPITWDLKAGQTWRFQFPTGNVVFYDPNLTPPGADPLAGDYVNVTAPMTLGTIMPSGYGTYSAAANTFVLLGPAATGGPDGSPGNYALDPWPQLTFVPKTTSFGTLAGASSLSLDRGREGRMEAASSISGPGVAAIGLWSILATADPVRRTARLPEEVP